MHLNALSFISLILKQTPSLTPGSNCGKVRPEQYAIYVCPAPGKPTLQNSIAHENKTQ